MNAAATHYETWPSTIRAMREVAPDIASGLRYLNEDGL